MLHQEKKNFLLQMRLHSRSTLNNCTARQCGRYDSKMYNLYTISKSSSMSFTGFTPFFLPSMIFDFQMYNGHFLFSPLRF